MQGPYRTRIEPPPRRHFPPVPADDEPLLDAEDGKAVAGLAPNELPAPELELPGAEPPRPLLYRADTAVRRGLVRLGLMRARFIL